MKNEQILVVAKKVEDALKKNNLPEAKLNAETVLRGNKSAGLAYKGVIALREGDLDVAERYLLESFQINAKQHLALANLIPTYIKKRDFKKAAAFGEQAYEVMPENQSVCINYAAALLQEQDHQKALEVLKPHHNEESPNVSVLSGMISCYRTMFMKKEADELLQLADKHFGSTHEIIRLKADTLAERDPESALISFEKALELDPLNVATKWNMSLVQLRLGDFANGWVNYDNGLLPEVGKIGRPLPKLFEGANLITDFIDLDVKKWTFVVCEQGIGDQVLFLGALNEFIQDYPKTILIAEKRFQPILTRSFPDLPIYNYGVGTIIPNNIEVSNGIIPIG